MASRASKRVIYAALVGNLLVASTKFVASGLTGSSAMASEAVHSLVDTGNEILLLYGLHRAAKPPDELHPLGHGRELYFWSFIVALLVFTLGAGVSLYQGVRHIIAPAPMSHPIVNYVVLGLALVFEGGSWGVAIKEFRAAKGKRGYLEAARQSKDPTMFMVLFEDTAALIGLMIALAGITASHVLGRPGAGWRGVHRHRAPARHGGAVPRPREQGPPHRRARRVGRVTSICAIAHAQPGVERSSGLFTVHLGPDQVVAAITATSGTPCPPLTWRRPSPRSRTGSKPPIPRSCC